MDRFGLENKEIYEEGDYVVLIVYKMLQEVCYIYTQSYP